MERDSDGQHRASGPANNDGQCHVADKEFSVGQKSGGEQQMTNKHIGLDYNISTTSHAAGGLNYGEKKGGADDQK